jgi:hypothetical protein
VFIFDVVTVGAEGAEGAGPPPPPPPPQADRKNTAVNERTGIPIIRRIFIVPPMFDFDLTPGHISLMDIGISSYDIQDFLKIVLF